MNINYIYKYIYTYMCVSSALHVDVRMCVYMNGYTCIYTYVDMYSFGRSSSMLLRSQSSFPCICETR